MQGSDYCFFFTFEEPESQGGNVICPRPHKCKIRQACLPRSEFEVRARFPLFSCSAEEEWLGAPRSQERRAPSSEPAPRKSRRGREPGEEGGNLVARQS